MHRIFVCLYIFQYIGSIVASKCCDITRDHPNNVDYLRIRIMPPDGRVPDRKVIRTSSVTHTNTRFENVRNASHAVRRADRCSRTIIISSPSVLCLRVLYTHYANQGGRQSRGANRRARANVWPGACAAKMVITTHTHRPPINNSTSHDRDRTSNFTQRRIDAKRAVSDAAAAAAATDWQTKHTTPQNTCVRLTGASPL